MKPLTAFFAVRQPWTTWLPSMPWLGRALAVASVAVPLVALAAESSIAFSDPAGDDTGPGSYKYPTNPEYKTHAFDLRKLEVTDKGDEVEFKVTMGASIDDPWNSRDWPDGGGNGFSLQFVQVYIDTDHQKGSGHTSPLPGLGKGNFADDEAWDKVVLISPQPRTRLSAEVKAKAGAMKARVVVPKSTRASGKSLIAVVKKSDLGEFSAKWGFNALVQSNEGFPVGKDILTRPVNQTAGPHRFGGGDDSDCDPQWMDMLAGKGKGDGSETQAQYSAMKYSCGGKVASIPMIYAGE